MALNFLDFTDPNDPRFGIDNPYDLYQYYSNPSLTEQETTTPPLTQQTVFNPLTNYFGDDDDEEDVINRDVNINRNFNPITTRNALQYGIGALINPILGYAAGRAYDYFNPPTPTMNYDFDGDVADQSTGSYSTNPGIGFSNIDPQDVQQFSQADIDRQDYADYGTAAGESAAESAAADAEASESYSDSEMD